MEEHTLRNRLYAYLFYGLAALALASSLFFYNAYLLAFSIVLMLISAVYYNSGHIINNILLKRSLIIETYNGYSLSDDLYSAVKMVGDGNYSVSMATLRLNRGAEAENSKVLSLLEGLDQPFEFIIQLREVNKKSLLESLETKRRMKEIAFNRITGSYDKANELKREISVIEQEIVNIRGNGKALEVLIRLKTTSVSVDKSEAARSSARNIEHIANSFSTMLNASCEILKGEALLSALEVS